jgi:arginase family enzyme
MFDPASSALCDAHAGRDNATGTADPDLELMMSGDVVIESVGPNYVVLANLETAARIRVSNALYEFVRHFRTQTRLADLVGAEALEKLRPQIELLVSREILIDTRKDYGSGKRRLLTNVAYRFCNAPAFDNRNPADFTVLGLPCDTETANGSRLAPEAMRRKSLDFPFRCGIEDNRPMGWFDADLGQWILKDVSICDAGDVIIEHGETRECLYDRVRAVLTQCLSGGSIPIILGGDQIATEATLLAIGGEFAPEFARLREDATLSLPAKGAATYLSLDLAACNEAFHSPQSSTAHSLASLAELKAQIRALGRTNPIVAIDVVGIDMHSHAGRLGAAMGCQLLLAAMEAAYAGRP